MSHVISFPGWIYLNDLKYMDLILSQNRRMDLESGFRWIWFPSMWPFPHNYVCYESWKVHVTNWTSSLIFCSLSIFYKVFETLFLVPHIKYLCSFLWGNFFTEWQGTQHLKERLVIHLRVIMRREEVGVLAYTLMPKLVIFRDVRYKIVNKFSICTLFDVYNPIL